MEIKGVTLNLDNAPNCYPFCKCTIKWDGKAFCIDEYPVKVTYWVFRDYFILETEQAVHFFYMTEVFKMLYQGNEGVNISIPIKDIMLGIKAYNGHNLKKGFTNAEAQN